MMKKLYIKITLAAVVLLPIVVLTGEGLAQNQQSLPPVLPETSPNLIFNVIRKAGKCPQNISLWTSSRRYQGGNELTVIADTDAIASPLKLVYTNRKAVKYKAPLQQTYASCTGQAISKKAPYYKFRFHNGELSFRVHLPPDSPSKPSIIRDTLVINNRPYVRWQIAD